MSINPYRSPESAGDSPVRQPKRWRARLLGYLAAAGGILMLGGLLLPAHRGAPNAAARNQCSNNLKLIAIALRNYEAVHHTLPPAYTVDAEGRPLHSWRTLILPFMGRQDLYEKIDLTKPWDDPANKAVFDAPLGAYRCPLVQEPATHTTYFAVVAPGSCFQATEPRKLSDVVDSDSATLMVIEVDSQRAVHWMSPTDATEADVLRLGTDAGQAHPGGAQVLFVDGSVQFLRSNIQPDMLRAMISIDGNDAAIVSEAGE